MALIAGVQGQIIASTFSKNDTVLQRVTNGFAFVGMTFDIVGTSFGLFHALRAEHYSQRYKNELEATHKNHIELEDTVRKNGGLPSKRGDVAIRYYQSVDGGGSSV
jgi:hypothetical protein